MFACCNRCGGRFQEHLLRQHYASGCRSGFQSMPNQFSPRAHLKEKNTNDSLTLYFGGAIKKNSLIGGSSWWLAAQDYHEKAVATGSNSVIQTFSSLIRLEYEGLLNGLKAAFQRGVRRLVIKGSSMITISHYSHGQVSAYLQTVYHGIDDLHVAILKLLGQFDECVLELIPHDRNYYAHKLAENVIAQYYTKRLQRFERVLTESTASSERVSPTASNCTSSTATLSSGSPPQNVYMAKESSPRTTQPSPLGPPTPAYSAYTTATHSYTTTNNATHNHTNANSNHFININNSDSINNAGYHQFY